LSFRDGQFQITWQSLAGWAGRLEPPPKSPPRGATQRRQPLHVGPTERANELDQEHTKTKIKMKTKIADRIRGAFAVGLSTLVVAAVLLAPTSAEAWHVNFYLYGFFPIPVWITITK
jgi:hypothetical protein